MKFFYSLKVIVWFGWWQTIIIIITIVRLNPYGEATNHKGFCYAWWTEFLRLVFGCKNYMQNCANMTLEIFSLTWGVCSFDIWSRKLLLLNDKGRLENNVRRSSIIVWQIISKHANNPLMASSNQGNHKGMHLPPTYIYTHERGGHLDWESVCVCIHACHSGSCNKLCRKLF